MYLETERVYLRNYILEDVQELIDYRNDESCSKYQRGQHKDREHLEALVEKTKDDVLISAGEKRFAIADKISGTIMGDIFISIKEPCICMGYTLSYKHHRKGIMFELLSKLIEVLHKEYPSYEFVCCTDKENEPSKALLKKLGYSYEGYEEKIDSDIFVKYKII